MSDRPGIPTISLGATAGVKKPRKSVSSNKSSSNTSTKTTSSGGRSSRSGGGGSGGGGYSYGKAQRKAGRKYIEQAQNLEAQAAALRYALDTSLKQQLDTKLANVSLVLGQQLDSLKAEYLTRYKSFAESAADNEYAHGTTSGINLLNSRRERANAFTEAMNVGAGETDTLNTMVMGLRNWSANQNEAERAYADTLTGLRSDHRDATLDTQRAMSNMEIQANADKEQLWSNYYDSRAEVLTDLGNVRGQQADYFASAKEYGVNGIGGGKGKKGKKAKKIKAAPLQRVPGAVPNELQRELGLPRSRPQKPVKRQPGAKPKRKKNGAVVLSGWGEVRNKSQAFNQAERAYMEAAQTKGQAWTNPGVSADTLNWQPNPDFENKSQMSNELMAPRTRIRKAEGASLRSWA